MGKATIIANLGLPVANYSARYTIEFDLGVTEKTAALAKLNTALNENTTKANAVTAELAAIEATATTLRIALVAAEFAYIAALTAAGPDAPAPDGKALKEAMQALQKHLLKTLLPRFKLAALKADRNRLLSDVARWNAFQATETKPAWALDFVDAEEGLAVGAQVSTLEINGEQGLSFIVGQFVSGDQDRFGRLVGRQVMSAEQVFFNTAILPGWQRFFPMYRIGVVEALYIDVSRIRVALDPASSSAQSLSINPESAVIPLAQGGGIGIDSYLPGDRVIVSFQPGRSFDGAASVVGWVDGPQRPARTVFYSPGSQSARLTRLNRTAYFEVPDLTPDAVALTWASSVAAGYADNFETSPATGPVSYGTDFYYFPRDLTDPVVTVELFGGVSYNLTTELWDYSVVFFIKDDFFQPPSAYPKQYRDLGIDFIQTVPSTTYTGSGFASAAAAYDAVNAEVIEIAAKAVFQNGSECDLVCEKHADGNAISGFYNRFRIKSCTPDKIGPL